MIDQTFVLISCVQMKKIDDSANPPRIPKNRSRLFFENIQRTFDYSQFEKDRHQIDRGRKELAIQNLEFHFISLPSPNCAMLVEIIRKSLTLEFTRISPFVATPPSVNKKEKKGRVPPFPRVERRRLFDGSWKSQLKKESRWYWTTCCAYTKGCKRVRHRIEGYIDDKLLLTGGLKRLKEKSRGQGRCNCTKCSRVHNLL